MLKCERCGEEFKPYWQLTEIQDKKCEKCFYLENEKKELRLWTALIKIGIGFLLLIITPQSNVPFTVFGFLLIILGLVKLIEDAFMHRHSLVKKLE
jgi:hypothetical protein